MGGGQDKGYPRINYKIRLEYLIEEMINLRNKHIARGYEWGEYERE